MQYESGMVDDRMHTEGRPHTRMNSASSLVEADFWPGAVFPGSLVTVRSDINTTAYKANYYSKQVLFEGNPFIGQHDWASVQKARFINTWFDKFHMEEL